MKQRTDTQTPAVHLSAGNLAGGELLAASGPFLFDKSQAACPPQVGKGQGARGKATHGPNHKRAPEPDHRPRDPHGWWLLPFAILGGAVTVKVTFTLIEVLRGWMP